MAINATAQQVENLNIEGVIQDCADDYDCYEFVTELANNT
jgi:hypothetical protein